MCLYFNPQDSLEKFYARRDAKPITAYKVLRRYNKKLYGPYRSQFEWKLGINMSDRGCITNGHGNRLTKEESKAGFISHGLHLMQDLNSAWKTASGCRDNPNDRSVEVWEVKIDPKQIISYGRFYGQDAIVAHKVELVRRVLKREKKGKK